jgi:hypothetical protein
MTARSGVQGSGNIELAEKNLSIKMGAPPRSMFNGLPVYDFTNNFFLAKTETLRDVPWDNRFKIYGEHTDFFLRYSARYKVTFVTKWPSATIPAVTVSEGACFGMRRVEVAGL